MHGKCHLYVEGSSTNTLSKRGDSSDWILNANFAIAKSYVIDISSLFDSLAICCVSNTTVFDVGERLI